MDDKKSVLVVNNLRSWPGSVEFMMLLLLRTLHTLAHQDGVVVVFGRPPMAVLVSETVPPASLTGLTFRGLGESVDTCKISGV